MFSGQIYITDINTYWFAFQMWQHKISCWVQYKKLFPIGSNKDELHFIAIGFILIKIKSFQVLMIKIINKHLNKNIQKENQN